MDISTRTPHMNLPELVKRLDTELRTDAYADIDGSPNGLQVGRSDPSIESVALAVDAAESTIQQAIDQDVDLLMTHHGLWWEGIERVTGPTHTRLHALLSNDIGLYVSHLPLDGHQDIGNAAVIACDLGLTQREPFGALNGEFVGQAGVLPEPISRTDFVTLVSDILPGEPPIHVLPHGPENLQHVGIITGSGTDWIAEAASAELDVLLTGEGKHAAYHASKEAGVNLVLGGHYATETGGLREIATLLEEWGIVTTFIDEPTGL